jgi:hypothetical protein
LKRIRKRIREAVIGDRPRLHRTEGLKGRVESRSPIAGAVAYMFAAPFVWEFRGQFTYLLGGYRNELGKKTRGRSTGK